MTTEQRAHAAIALIEHLTTAHIAVLVEELMSQGTPQTAEDGIKVMRNLIRSTAMSAALSVCDRFKRVKDIDPEEEWAAFNLAAEKLGFAHTRVGTVTKDGDVIPGNPFQEN